MDKVKVYAWPKNKNTDRNPYNKLLYDEFDSNFAIKEFTKKDYNIKDGDILHVHWPDHMLRSSKSLRVRFRLWRFLKFVERFKKRGGKLVWTVHNLQPHEYVHSSLMNEGIKKIVSVVDGFIFLSEENKTTFQSLHQELDKQKFAVIPHLHYKHFYSKFKNLNSISFNDTVKYKLLCFGLIRKHKGYESLFNLIASHPISFKNIGWILAGNPGKEGISNELAKAIDKVNVLSAEFRHISDEEIVPIFNSSDAVIVPYQDILNSGTAILALSLGKRVIAPALGSLMSLQNKVGVDWVYLYSPPLSKEKLDNALAWLEVKPQSLEPNIDFMSPKNIANMTGNFYKTLLSDTEP